METAPLKSFATSARRELIGEVRARILAVLAEGSYERREHPQAIAHLGRALEAEGRGEQGRQAVAGRVAYIWFNRIVALRFMDALGYTGVGVVSPPASQAFGQPEILANAKGGLIDSQVVSEAVARTVHALLDGQRPSQDPQGEAYALLLKEYCRHWHQALPFMFGKDTGYTDLLVPSNLLADASILERARDVLSREVCQDVEAIGWLYQFYISEQKDEVFAGFKKNQKAGSAEIPAATQLFTPHWIVRYLVENSVGRLWMLNHPGSQLVEQMDYYIAPVEEETDFLKISNPEELKIIDPACGSGHMLTYAFDLLYAIYEEEGYAPSEIPSLILTHNLYGTEIDPRAGALAAFALTMKALARQRRFLRKGVQPNICVLEPIHFTSEEVSFLLTSRASQHKEIEFWTQFENADVLGSLIQPDAELLGQMKTHLDTLSSRGDVLHENVLERAHRVIAQAEYLTRRYNLAVANPPYMGNGNMGSALARFGKEAYPFSWSDLFAMFIERSLTFVVRDGYVAMITMQSWMYLTSFEKLRMNILKTSSIDTLVHLGAGAFSTIGGAVVSTCAFVLNAGRVIDHPGFYVDVTTSSGELGKKTDYLEALRTDSGRTFLVPSPDFRLVPGAPIAYALEERAVFARQNLGSRFRSGGRLKTHDNARYVRNWWEVRETADSKWRFLHNGGPRVAFYGNDEEVADWSVRAQHNYGKHGGLPKGEAMGRVGITWTLVGSAAGSFRLRGADDLFSSGSPTIVCDLEDEAWAYLAALNSSAAGRLLETINPTINTVVGNILALPTLEQPSLEKLAPMAKEAYRFAERRYASRESSPKFVTCTALSGQAPKPSLNEVAAQQLARAIDESDAAAQVLTTIDAVVSEDWGVPCPSRLPVAAPTASVWNKELTQDLISYAVGCMFGRYSLDEPGLILANQGATLQDYFTKVPAPSLMPDSENVIPIVDGDWFEDDIVARFRRFTRAAFGEEHFEENLQFIEEALGVKSLREYFISKLGKSKFYDDHVKRYKKRPIYWMFASPKGSFNALIYVHRYTPSTVSTVLNDYLREYRNKLQATRAHYEHQALEAGSTRERAQLEKEAERLRKIIVELGEYEHDVLYPLATKQITIDLDDGVKANYPKFGSALKKIPGLSA